MPWGRRTTERQRFNNHEARLEIYHRDMGRCQTCGELVPMDAFEVAHRIADTKANRKAWSAAVIDHPINKRTTHRGNCNSAQNIGNRPLEAQRLAELIGEAIKCK